jgi:hypothetical protein
MNFGQRTPGSKDALGFARHFVVVSLDKMDRLAVQELAIRSHLLNASHAKIPKKIERIVWLDVRVHPIRDARIHLFSVLKRTLAIADDVEVSEVKIGCKPGIGHVLIMKDRLPGRLLLCSRKDCSGSLPRRSRCQPGWTRNMSTISRLLIVNIIPLWNYIDMEAFNEEQRST